MKGLFREARGHLIYAGVELSTARPQSTWDELRSGRVRKRGPLGFNQAERGFSTSDDSRPQLQIQLLAGTQCTDGEGHLGGIKEACKHPIQEPLYLYHKVANTQTPSRRTPGLGVVFQR